MQLKDKEMKKEDFYQKKILISQKLLKLMMIRKKRIKILLIRIILLNKKIWKI